MPPTEGQVACWGDKTTARLGLALVPSGEEQRAWNMQGNESVSTSAGWHQQREL